MFTPRPPHGVEPSPTQGWVTPGPAARVIVLQDPTADRAAGIDAWSRLWASRVGVAVASAVATPGRTVVRVALTDRFDPARDYLVQETQKNHGKQFDLTLLAGTNPPWAEAPTQWSDWVWSAEVQQSAVEFLRATLPGLADAITYADSLTEKVAKIRQWRMVADAAGSTLDRNLGKLQAGSWTSVAAMPVRLAQRIGGWTPPTPKPAFHKPDESGRVLVAAPVGISGTLHPKVGRDRDPADAVVRRAAVEDYASPYRASRPPDPALAHGGGWR